MTVQELIVLLQKCEPTADVMLCYGDDGRADVVGFVQHCLTDESGFLHEVFLYEDEPNWDEFNDDRDVELVSFSKEGDCFAETSYQAYDF